MLDEISHIFVGKINDLDRLRRIGEIGVKELAEVIPRLKRYQFAYKNLTDDVPIRVIQAPPTMRGLRRSGGPGGSSGSGASDWRTSGRYRFIYGDR